MNRLFLLVLLALVALATTEQRRRNEEHGTFYLWKVKPRSDAQIRVLTGSHASFGSNPLIFLQNFSTGDSNLVLVEQSILGAFAELLRTNKIKAVNKGLSLVQSITARSPFSGPQPRSYCDCDYSKIGGCRIKIPPPEGWKCHCMMVFPWTCGGQAMQCEPNETCPANCATKSCCQTGKGDCGGYP